MSGIFGHLGLGDNERIYSATTGQRAIYDAATAWVSQRNAELNAIISVLVDGTTEDHTERYYLPGGGRLPERGELARSPSSKATGYWDVAYPLKDFGAEVSGTDIDYAYMTVAELDRHIQSVVARNTNTVRFEILRALLNNAARTFIDPRRGSLSVQPLANGDSVVYPPVLGSESEATDDHYLGANYLSSAISDTNNPLVTIRDELEEHFGATQGGSNIVVWINPAQSAKVEALTDFSEVPDRFTQVGANTDFATGLPAGLPGERIIGRSNGVWVVEWRWMPANYALGVHLDAPAPLKIRVDPADTGIARGLTMLPDEDDAPFRSMRWRHRFGVGVANRLNGVVMHITNSSSYTVPTGY